MPHKTRKTYDGPTLLSYGFRPFFLLAILFAAIIIPIWINVYAGAITLQSPFSPVDWHIHEMLFGYTAAVICGFLFTAIPNWTGRMPIRGWPLAVLIILWVMGRLVMAGIGGLVSPLMAMLIDCSFLLAVSIMIVIEIVAGKNWRNLKIVIPILLFLGSNIWFHLEVMNTGTSDYSRRASFAVVIFLITLIGGRIIPSFTRNWLVKSNPGKLPIPFNRFDVVCILAGAVSMTFWIIRPDGWVTGWLLIIAAVLHIIRLLRWRGLRTMGSPLLLMLHMSYGFLPLGFIIIGLGMQPAGLHLLGIGAIGCMTVAVMVRATLGHTGRELVSGFTPAIAFMLIVTAAFIRSFGMVDEVWGVSGIEIAAAFWTIGYGMLLMKVGPWLWSANVKKRTPNK